MTLTGRNRTIILSAVILGVGIIHLGVGIGIVAKYSGFNDIYQQQIGLSGYTIVIGLFTMFVGILGLVAALHRSILFSKLTAIASFILGIFVLASLITALALSGQSSSYMFDTMTDHMNRYAQRQDSMDVINKLQTTYECCGVSLWLDWARVSLGVPVGGGNGGTIIGGRRRREETSSSVFSPLVQSIRQKRQTVGNGGYNFPSQYTFNMPLSCCRNGGVGGGATVGGYCVFLASNGTGSFFLEGCYRHVANRGASQITGIAVINTFLLILTFVNFAKLVTVFSQDPNKSNIYNQQQTPYQYNPQQQQQQQQYQYDPYYSNYNNQNAYYAANDPNYKMYL